MKITTLSLELASGQTQLFGEETTLAGLKAQLKDILDSVALVDANDVLTMPTLIIQAKFRLVEITFTYELLDKEEGLLALYYNNGKDREQQKVFGYVRFEELEQHLQKLLRQSEREFIEYYFPKQTKLMQVIKYTVIAYLCVASFGFMSLGFFPNLIWREVFFQSAYVAAAITYVMSLPILIISRLLKEKKEQVALVRQSTTKQVIAILVVNVFLSCGVIVGGSNLFHVITAEEVKIDIVFSDKSRDYWSKHCKGGVNVEHFYGAVCLEDKAYWQVIHPGIRAVAQGESSAIAFNVESLELK
ncbi:hypothetical protein AB4298_20580 [Shewanella sp. 10N.261.52.F9]|uniref:hypothetical protein n=1 Tax=Shewanella sp. 10N.261.52.F9 TaxID=3229684 RepID=UPI00354C2EC2